MEKTNNNANIVFKCLFSVYLSVLKEATEGWVFPYQAPVPCTLFWRMKEAEKYSSVISVIAPVSRSVKYRTVLITLSSDMCFSITYQLL